MLEINFKAIQPLDVAGCRFFINNRFITAGHCLQGHKTFVWFNDKNYLIEPHNILVSEIVTPEVETNNQPDIAIINFDDYSGPSLNYSPKIHELNDGDKVLIGYYEYIPAKKSENGFGYENQESYIFKTCQGHIINDIFREEKAQDLEKNYFEVEAEVPLKRVNSGSPIFDSEGNVICLLTHGAGLENNNHRLIFQKLYPFNQYFN